MTERKCVDGVVCVCPEQELRSAREMYAKEQAIMRAKAEELEHRLREQQQEQERLMAAKEKRLRDNRCDANLTRAGYGTLSGVQFHVTSDSCACVRL